MTEKLFTKNFMLLILGQLTSLFGNFILKLALSMYVLEATGSAAIFAGILSAAIIPAILLSPDFLFLCGLSSDLMQNIMGLRKARWQSLQSWGALPQECWQRN